MPVTPDSYVHRGDRLYGEAGNDTLDGLTGNNSTLPICLTPKAVIIWLSIVVKQFYFYHFNDNFLSGKTSWLYKQIHPNRVA